MKNQIFGRQLQRDTHERKALFNSLMSALIVHESIKTTEAKAKAIKGQIEKFVTKAKTDSQAQRRLQAHFSHDVLQKLLNDVAPRFVNRPGGYTRIIRLGKRLRDNAKMVMLEWVEKKPEIVTGEVMNEEETKSVSKKEANEKVEATAVIEKKTKKEVPVKEK